MPLICEARISNSPASVWSRLAVTVRDMVSHSFISEGAAAIGSSLAVMIGVPFHGSDPMTSQGGRV